MLSESCGFAAEGQRALRRFLIVDPHESVRRALRRLIERRSDWCVAGEAVCAADAWRMARESLPEVVIVDPCLRSIDGRELPRKLAAVVPGARLVGYSLKDDRRSVSRFLESGGHGFVSKTASPDALVATIEQALADPIRDAATNEDGSLSPA